MNSIRIRTYQIVEAARPNDRTSFAFDLFIITLIVLNIAAVILETVESIAKDWGALFLVFEVFSVVIFTIEYILRLWSCTVDEAYRRPVTGRLRFALRPMMIIDLLAILPSLLIFVGFADTRALRAFRLFRVFRLFKLGRYSRSLRVMGNVFRSKREDLIMTTFALTILLIVASSLMYYAEHEAQPDVFSSIPATFWWGVATLTTVGYGDAYPITPWGKMLGGAIAVLGIGFFAVPTGILGAGFSEEMARERENPDPDPDSDT